MHRRVRADSQRIVREMVQGRGGVRQQPRRPGLCLHPHAAQRLGRDGARARASAAASRRQLPRLSRPRSRGVLRHGLARPVPRGSVGTRAAGAGHAGAGPWEQGEGWAKRFSHLPPPPREGGPSRRLGLRCGVVSCHASPRLPPPHVRARSPARNGTHGTVVVFPRVPRFLQRCCSSWRRAG